jgi:iron-sulfur cluster insertion protein
MSETENLSQVATEVLTLMTVVEPSQAAADPLTFTPAAIARVQELLSLKGNEDLKLRIYIVGGGCSGFQYAFSFDKTLFPDDTIVQKSVDSARIAATFAIDMMSLPYLIGATLDYVKNLQGAKFVVINPNAQTTCGCGSSFSM